MAFSLLKQTISKNSALLKFLHINRYPHYIQLSFKSKMVNAKKSKKPVAVVSEKDKPNREVPLFVDEQGRIAIRIHAKPGAKKSAIVEIGEQEVSVSIGAAPREGAANEELISYLMNLLSLRKNEIYFDKGAKSRSKIILIETNKLNLDDVRNKLLDDIGT